jgi:hypothetical protein
MVLNDGTSSAGRLEAFTAIGDMRGPVIEGLLGVTGPALGEAGTAGCSFKGSATAQPLRTVRVSRSPKAVPGANMRTPRSVHIAATKHQPQRGTVA